MSDDALLRLLREQQEQLRALTEQIQRLSATPTPPPEAPSPPPSPSEPLTGELWRQWLTTITTSSRLRSVPAHWRYIAMEFEFGGRKMRLADLPPSRCTPPLLQAWIGALRASVRRDGKPISNGYVNQIRLSVQAAYRYGNDMGMCERNPLAKIPLLDGGRTRKRLGYITLDVLESFVRYCRPVVADLFRLTYYCGFRFEEMRMLRKSEYDQDKKVVYLSAERNKNKKARTVIIISAAQEILERNVALSRSEAVLDHPVRRNGGFIPTSTLRNWIIEDRDKAIADGFDASLAGDLITPHLGRHGYCVRLQGHLSTGHISNQMGCSAKLVDELYGALRGATATDEARARIEVATQVDPKERFSARRKPPRGRVVRKISGI